MEAATAPQVQAPAPAAAAPAASYAAPEAAPAPAPQEMKLIAAALPAGDPAAFDRDSLSSICSFCKGMREGFEGTLTSGILKAKRDWRELQDRPTSPETSGSACRPHCPPARRHR